MALAKDTRRIVLTFNPNKSNDKIILDFLDMQYNDKEKIKEIIYNYIVCNGDKPLFTLINENNSESIQQLNTLPRSSNLLKVNELEGVNKSDKQLNTVYDSELIIKKKAALNNFL